MTLQRNKRPLESQDDSSNMEFQDEIDSAAISLQEQIELEEITLKALLERRAQVARQLVSEEQKWHRLQDQTVVLQERKVTLQEARTKHSSLRTELQESLQKSRDKLSKLEKLEAATESLPSTATSVDEELVSEIPNETTVNDVFFPEEKTTTGRREAEGNNNEVEALHDIIPSLRIPVLDALALHEWYRKERPQDKRMRSNVAFHPFLSMVNAKLVSKIMRHYQMETLVLDQIQETTTTNPSSSILQDSSPKEEEDQLQDSFPSSERAIQESTLRRSLLRNTCLDFSVLLSPKEDNDPQEITVEDHPAREEESSFLDSPQNASSTLHEVDNSTLTSAAAAATALVDPNIPLCPYELAGICADEYCPYQHTDPNRKPILSRELLPLPALNLKALMEKEDDDTKSKGEKFSKQTQPTQASESDVLATTTTEDHPPLELAPEESDEKKTGENSDEEEEEFITLPGAEEDEDEDMDIDESSSSSDEDVSMVESYLKEKQKQSSTFWWRFNHEMTIFSSHNLPVEDVLETLGGIKIVESVETKQMEVQLPEDGSSRREWIGWLGRLVDCCRIATFAGRHDLALAILDESLLAETLSKKGNQHSSMHPTSQDEETTRLSVMQTISEHELTSALRMLHRIRLVAYPTDSSLRYSVFHLAFAVHLSFAILSEYLKALWNAETQSASNELQQEQDSFRSAVVLLQTIDLLLGDDPMPSSEPGCIDPAEYVKIVFEPKTAIQENGENSFYEKLRDIVRFALDTLGAKSPALRSIPITQLEDKLLRPIWVYISPTFHKAPQESPSIHYLAGITLMGFVILSCFQRFAAHVERGRDALSPSLMAALASLDSSIQQILKTLKHVFKDNAHLLNLALAPLVAASVASACFLRQYSNAQNRLSMVMFRNQLSGSKWMQYSDLLWSQLVHLRMSLPVDSETDGNAIKTFVEGKRKRSFATEKGDLANLMESLGVRLNHISVIGDSNFTDLGSRSDKEVEQLSTASETIRQLILNPLNVPIGSKSINLDNIEIGCRFDVDREDASEPTTSPLPRSILLPIQCVELSLQKCKLESLPPSFGLDLTNVIRLDVSYNSLHRLPVSIASMTNLEELHLNHNLLAELPELPGSNLRVLNVSHNRLSVFPAFLLPDTTNGKSMTTRNGTPKRKKMRLRVDSAKAPCSFQKLEVLILANNCLDRMDSFHSKLILNLQNLRRLEIEPQDRTDD